LLVELYAIDKTIMRGANGGPEAWVASIDLPLYTILLQLSSFQTMDGYVLHADLVRHDYVHNPIYPSVIRVVPPI
jgi:hypothetical protein